MAAKPARPQIRTDQPDHENPQRECITLDRTRREAAIQRPTHFRRNSQSARPLVPSTDVNWRGWRSGESRKDRCGRSVERNFRPTAFMIRNIAHPIISGLPS